MNFADRTNWPRQPNTLTQIIQDLRARNVSYLDLTQSNPTECGFLYLRPALLMPFANEGILTYRPDAKGLRETREAVSRYYESKGIAVDPGRIFLTASTSEAYSFLFRLLANPKDRIALPRPSYPLFDFLLSLHDLEPSPYRLNYLSKRWRVDERSFDMALELDARAAIMVHPNNPTGSCIDPDERVNLLKLLSEHHIPLIVDEVFHDFTDEARFATFAGTQATLTFTLSGISKILGLPQMKISWIVISGPERECEEAVERLEIIADTYLSVSAPAQCAFPRWIETREPITGEISERVRTNRTYLASMLRDEAHFELLESDGGWYAVLKTDVPDEEFAVHLLEKDQVLIHPGYFYDMDSENYLIMSLIVPEDELRIGVRKMIQRAKELEGSKGPLP